MEQTLFDRFAQRLRDQRDTLTSWLRFASAREKEIRFGPAGENAIAGHLGALDNAIQQADDSELGRCTVCNGFVESFWLESDYTHCVCIEHLTGEERSRLESELELSQKVQRALLPQEVPQINGWEVAVFSRPASIVGGDYFDFGRFRNGHQAFVIADVMGKGMPASMLMASLQASLRIIIPESNGPTTVLDRVNKVFCHNINLTKFVTLFVAELDPANGVVRYANAGHNPPLVLRNSDNASARSIETLPPTGAAIGLLENARFGAEDIQIKAGESLVLYTDGVSEAGIQAGEMFGEERIKQYLLTSQNESATVLMRGLLQELYAFTQSSTPADDSTIMVVRRSADRV
jgi:phosphoserine phosphatase RsbU/P